MKLIVAVALSFGSIKIAEAQVPSATNRETVATTPAFRFHSDPLVGLHDFLIWRTSGIDSAPTDSCATASAEERAAFTRAQELYASKRPPNRNRFIIAMHYELTGFPDADVLPDSVTQPALALLRAALPAYCVCWWREHDARNRAWITDLLPRLRQHEDTIAARLARVYQIAWEGQTPVDVVSFANEVGAYTVGNPHHIMISSVPESHRGDGALEMAFHERSHTVVNFGHDIIGNVLGDTTIVGAGPVPPQLWHVLLFYTAGRITEQRLAETGRPGYEPYVNRMFRSVWPNFRAPIERHWQPYLDGHRSAADALRSIVNELRQTTGKVPR